MSEDTEDAGTVSVASSQETVASGVEAASDGASGDVEVTTRGDAGVEPVAGEVVESLLVVGEIVGVVKNDAGEITTCFLDFDGSDRVFPVATDAVLSDGVVQSRVSVAADDIPVVDESAANGRAVDISPTTGTETGAEEDRSYFVSVDVVRCGSGEYCVVDDVFRDKDTGVEAVQKKRSGERSDECLFTVSDVSVPGVGEDTVACNVGEAGSVRPVAKHASFERRESLSRVSGVEKRVLGWVDDEEELEHLVGELLPVVTGLCLTLFGGLLVYAASSFDAVTVGRAMNAFVGAVIVAGGLAVGCTYRLHQLVYSDSASVVDAAVARENAVAVPGVGGGDGAGGSVRSVRAVESVKMSLSVDTDRLVLTGDVDGEEVTWEWVRDASGRVPVAVSDVVDGTTPVYDDRVVVTVKEVGEGVTGEGSEGVLVSESGDWKLLPDS